MDWIIFDDVAELHQPCQEVELPLSAEDEFLTKKMCAYIDACFSNHAKDLRITPGIGIAAPQIGWFKRVFYINFIDERQIQRKLLIANPRKIAESAYSAYLSDGEGCLSVNKEYSGYSRRKAWIVVSGYDLINNKRVEFRADGLFGICVQHELDHLDGLLFYDRINKLNPFEKLDTDKVIK